MYNTLVMKGISFQVKHCGCKTVSQMVEVQILVLQFASQVTLGG